MKCIESIQGNMKKYKQCNLLALNHKCGENLDYFSMIGVNYLVIDSLFKMKYGDIVIAMSIKGQ